MYQTFFVTGEAGAGKTTRLMEQAVALGGEALTTAHQRALAMAVMHGARRHLRSALARLCPELPVEISTIHSFALKVVNRWRRSLGLTSPVTISDASCGLAEGHSRTQATFDEVVALAGKLLESSTVCGTLAETYPLVIVDEFQDCRAGTLKLIQNFRGSCFLLLAADHFQFLETDGGICPAVDWIEELRQRELVAYENLTKCRRTDDEGILRAARALRDNIRATDQTVPVYWAPTPEMLAWRLVERFLPRRNQIRSGKCALITLSLEDPLLGKLLGSFQHQLARHYVQREIRWSRHETEDKQRQQLLECLGVCDPRAVGAVWEQDKATTDDRATAVVRQIMSFAKLRGIDPIPQELVIQFAGLHVHTRTAFGADSPQFQVLTAHGAKNREFDHVFVFWSYKGARWTIEQQRRLLYNAVTRARCDCTVLVLGDAKRADQDSVISLLGPALPAIDPARTNRRRETKR
jgi:hypothetical protein